MSTEKPYLTYLTEYRSYNPQKGIGEWDSEATWGSGHQGWASVREDIRQEGDGKGPPMCGLYPSVS